MFDPLLEKKNVLCLQYSTQKTVKKQGDALAIFLIFLSEKKNTLFLQYSTQKNCKKTRRYL